jgi:hypothetical protein
VRMSPTVVGGAVSQNSPCVLERPVFVEKTAVPA